MVFLSLLEALFALIGFLVCIFVATLVIADWWQRRAFSQQLVGTEEQLPQEEEGVQP